MTAAHALTVVSGRSIGVPALSIERLRDLRKVRVELESVVAEWSVEHCDADGIAALRSHLAVMEAADAAADMRAFLRGNRAFHFEIYPNSGSPVALALIEGRMVEAIERKDRVALSAAIREDIDGAYRALIVLLS